MWVVEMLAFNIFLDLSLDKEVKQRRSFASSILRFSSTKPLKAPAMHQNQEIQKGLSYVCSPSPSCSKLLGCLRRPPGDLLPQFVSWEISPFWTGAFCSNLAWLTIWPLESWRRKMPNSVMFDFCFWGWFFCFGEAEGQSVGDGWVFFFSIMSPEL